MKQHRRRSVAFILGALFGKRHNVGAVYDFGAAQHFNFGLTANGRNISAYDFDRRTHVTGTVSDRQVAMYDHGESEHFSITLKPNRAFSGYDFGTSTHFSGQVQGHSITLYDFETASHYIFSV